MSWPLDNYPQELLFRTPSSLGKLRMSAVFTSTNAALFPMFRRKNQENCLFPRTSLFFFFQCPRPLPTTVRLENYLERLEVLERPAENLCLLSLLPIP